MLSIRCWWQRKCQGERQWVAIPAEKSGCCTKNTILIAFQLEAELIKVEDVEDWRFAVGETENGD